jgi:hypothetical protein
MYTAAMLLGYTEVRGMLTTRLPFDSPNKLLRSFPALNAEQIKRTTLAIINMIPDDIYEEIVVHAR